MAKATPKALGKVLVGKGGLPRPPNTMALPRKTKVEQLESEGETTAWAAAQPVTVTTGKPNPPKGAAKPTSRIADAPMVDASAYLEPTIPLANHQRKGQVGKGYTGGRQVAVSEDPVWLRLMPQDPICLQGFAPEGPALWNSAALASLLGVANELLADLLGTDQIEEVQLHKDDGETFQEVSGALVRSGATAGPLSFTLALYSSRGLWSVGVAAGKTPTTLSMRRDKAAHLSMCCALVLEGWSRGEQLITQELVALYPGFKELCDHVSATAETPPGVPVQPRLPKAQPHVAMHVPASWPPPAAAPRFVPEGYESFPEDPEPVTESKSSKKRKKTKYTEEEWAEWERQEAERKLAKSLSSLAQPVAAPLALEEDPLALVPSLEANGVEGTRLPRDFPIFLRLEPEAMSENILGLTPDVFVVCAEGGGKSSKSGVKPLYSQAEQVLSQVLPEADLNSIELLDDPNWEHFPGIGAALKTLATEEECLSVAVCHSLNAWAVGVSMQGKKRYAAARAALAVTLAVQAGDLGELWNVAEFPLFAQLVEEARNAMLGGF